MKYYCKSNIIVSTLFLVLSWFLQVGFSQQLLNSKLSIGDMPCVEKLAPCEPYVKRPGTASGMPPDMCCKPLKEMIADEADCLCNVFNSPDMLQSMNTTKDDALKLTKACGLEADVSECNKLGSSGSSPSGNKTAAHTSKSTSSTAMITPCGLVLTFASLYFLHTDGLRQVPPY